MSEIRPDVRWMRDMAGVCDEVKVWNARESVFWECVRRMRSARRGRRNVVMWVIYFDEVFVENIFMFFRFFPFAWVIGTWYVSFVGICVWYRYRCPGTDIYISSIIYMFVL